MKTKILAALLVAASATLAAPAFASGYGPAPFYRPGVTAPASQQGQSAQTVAAEHNSAATNSGNNAYGGVDEQTSQSGTVGQSNQPLTRAQVRADLVQVEQAGYNPANGRDPYYPQDIQAAEARIAAKNATAQADTTGYGSGTNGTSQVGQRAEVTNSSYSPPVYVGH
jgi:hypothetical protein